VLSDKQVINASVAGPAIADEVLIVKLIRTAAKTEKILFILLPPFIQYVAI